MSVATESLKICRKLWGNPASRESPEIQFKGQFASDAIRRAVLSPEPCMISRFGSVELSAVLCSMDSQSGDTAIQKFKRFVNGEIGFYWWTRSLKQRMKINAGFFPSEERYLNRFGERILNDISLIDVIGSWQSDEQRLSQSLTQATFVPLNDLYPLDHEFPWTSALEGKTVLVVHPFDKTIRQQYEKRELLFKDTRLLPQFKLKTLRAVQSGAGEKTGFHDWFEALDYMRRQISQIDFDVAIIGAGAYGMPLAADIKRMGKNAIHLGGITQVMFGVMGNRWSYLSHLFNNYWVRPSADETPPNSRLVEAACYW